MPQVRADLLVHQRIVPQVDHQVLQVIAHQVAVAAVDLQALPQAPLQEVHQEVRVEAVVVEEDN